MSRVPRRAPAVARYFRNVEAIPVDYYVVFSELEAQLADEFDFVKEAAAMERIGDALCTSDDGLPCSPPLVTPRPVAGLVTRRVLVMDYLPGEPRSRVTAIGPTATGPTATGPTATWSAPSFTRATPATQAAPPHPGHSRARC